MAKKNDGVPDRQVAYWQNELDRAKKNFRTFHDNGDAVVDAYRLQKEDGADALSKDKYNILYSSTETIRPNLYAQTPLPRVVLRSKDTSNDTLRTAAGLMEGCLKYIVDEEDFDEGMDSVVEDFLLPGLGCGWVRYEATFEDKIENGTPVLGSDNKTPVQELLDEMVKIEYVYWKDFLVGPARVWKDTPWVARRVWLTKEAATKRFGPDKANQLTYTTKERTGREADTVAETAEAWEIWDKATKTVYWFAEGLKELLDTKADPLKLKRFFPCPRPLRAISNTRTFVPRALYSQYKSQADTLNVQTKRIRLLSEALKVVGFFDGSQPKLADALNPASGNRMIAVDSWATFAQNGGIAGSVQWLPIDEVVKVLNELLKAREICKQEIYEITGFSDIVRGVSKASETLGAQNLKANWAGARVKKMQKEVQRFARDLIALAGEVLAEHCSPETIAVFSGIAIPTPEDVQKDPNLQAQIGTFTQACDLIKNEIRRVSSINIETDSTLLADEESERSDRTQFLAAAGAFLQQAVPAMEATPELGPLLGALLMFTVRTFPSSRPIEDEFEKVQQAMVSRGTAQDQDKDGKKAKAAADAQKAQSDAVTAQKELEVQQAANASKAQNDQLAEQNRHAEKMAELGIRQREVGIKERELSLAEQKIAIEQGKLDVARQEASTHRFAAQAAADDAEADHALDVQTARTDASLEERRIDNEAEAREADREAATEAREAPEPSEEG